jgi:hypothetical protein
VLRSYARLILFAAGLLVGVQIPNFVAQYVQRVDAHQIEAEKNFSGFQSIADAYFHGDVEGLIAHHAASTDPAFRQEAKTIGELYARVQMWRAEWAALRVSLAARIAHVLFRPNLDVRRETIMAYTYDVPLTPAAMASGIVLGALGALAFEIVVFGLIGAFLHRPRKLRRSRAAP